MVFAPDRSPRPDTLSRARQVIDTEIEGLAALRDGLDAAFLAVVDLLIATSGRLIVTGMGKSGHVARKIAATFASTGTPAQFVHPAEASHGDLGMIARGDVVLALSNFGETPEMADLIAYTRRFGIALVAATAVETSTLAKAADIVLLLPQANEACQITSAPTTSTTMMLALGDALALALLERRGFSPEDFRTFHPGGTLGRGLLRVSSVMHVENLPLVGLDTKVNEVILAMTAARFGCAGVLADDGTLAGIVTDGDLRRHLSSNVLEQTARRIMTPDPQTILPDTLAADALRLMNEGARQISVLFIVEAGRPIGILHIHDLLRSGVM